MSTKRVLILFSLLLSINTAYSQSENIDTMLQKIAAEKDDNNRIDLINDFTAVGEYNPILDMQFSQKLLVQSQNNKGKITETMALAEIGYDYKSFGKCEKDDRKIGRENF